jgi:hypothetical protein
MNCRYRNDGAMGKAVKAKGLDESRLKEGEVISPDPGSLISFFPLAFNLTFGAFFSLLPMDICF